LQLLGIKQTSTYTDTHAQTNIALNISHALEKTPHFDDF